MTCPKRRVTICDADHLQLYLQCEQGSFRTAVQRQHEMIGPCSENMSEPTSYMDIAHSIDIVDLWMHRPRHVVPPGCHARGSAVPHQQCVSLLVFSFIMTLRDDCGNQISFYGSTRGS